MQINKQTIFTFLIILVFGSGLSIYVWNKIQGRDLAQPPNFDLSAYNNFELNAEIDKRANEELQKIMAAKAQPDIVQPEVEVVETQKLETDFEPGYIYFRNSFGSTSVTETNSLIKSFLKDFPELKDAIIDNFETQLKAKVEIPALGREELLKNIKTEPEVLSVEVVEAPIWQVVFKGGKTEIEITEFFKKFPDIKVQPAAPKITIENYVARIKISDLKLEQAFLDKLQKEYSDVLKVSL